MTATLSSRGQIVIPQTVRERCQLSAGDHFGEMALLEGRDRHGSSVRAVSAVNVLTLGRDDFIILANKWEGLNETLDEVVKARH